MAKKMLIDATHPEETRVVVVDGQKVEDFDFESITKRQLAGNIYLAKVTRVEPSLQAAFVDYGGNRHGFLAFSEIHPDYYQIPVADREALLEEERREQEERKAREDNGGGEDTSSKSRRGGRGRRRKSSDTAEDGSKPAAAGAEVAGLEVIDLDDAAGEASSDAEPLGLEVAEAPDSDAKSEAASVDATSSADSEVAEQPGSNGSDVEVVEVSAAEEPVEPSSAAEDVETQTAEAPTEPARDGSDANVGEDTPAEDTPAAEPPSDPKSMAESAGLEDEERVSGDVGSTEARNKAQVDERSSASGEDLPETPAETATDQPEAAIEDPAPTTSEEAGRQEGAATAEASADPIEEPSTEDQHAVEADAHPPETESNADEAEPAEGEVIDGETATQEGSSDEPDDSDAEGGRSGKRGRRRRGRKPKSEEKAKTADKDGEPAEEDAEEGDIESIGAEDTLEEAARARTRLRRRYKIQDVIRVRQILLVQVVKEERGNKGAALTTYLSLAGRYCVLMPNTARGGGISRKITNAPDRKRLREVIGEMEVPQGMGLIVRTAGAERTRAEIKRDYEFLIRQWEQVRELTLKSIAPTLIYEEGSLIKRSIRDIYSKEIDQIQVEGDHGYREAKEYMKMLMPSHAKNVQPYTDQIPLFSRYQVESYLNGMFNPTCQLKSGGYIVIGVTEALVAIDVNSGRATKQGSIEETALQTNLEACDEVARQLRLRDLAGLIVIDFIDMDENRNNRAVEKRMKDRLKNDRARIQVGRISGFGLMEMSRQRLRPGMLEATTQPCPHCMGTGLIRSDESMSLSILREVEEEALRGRSNEINVRAPVDVANYLINNKRPHIAQLEARHNVQMNVLATPTLTSPNFELERTKSSTPRPQRQTDVVSASSVGNEDLDEAEVDVLTDGDDQGLPRDGSTDERGGRRRRGKRGGRRRRGEGEGEEGESQTAEAGEETSEEDEDGRGRNRNRRGRGRRRGGRGRKGGDGGEGDSTAENGAEASTDDAGIDAGEKVELEPTAEPVEAEATVEVETPAASAAAIEPTPSIEAPEDAVIAEDVSGAAPADPMPVEEATVSEPVPESVATQTAESDPAPEVELEAEPEPEPEPDPEPSKPKRRGWWSFGG
ncbi:MAG: Rne/Rng family ribonuclease [Pseudomonadota bacterium]